MNGSNEDHHLEGEVNGVSCFKQLQIVDAEQNFSGAVSDFMQNEWKLADQGFDYNVVAVFGSQSTGKSTLLNLLFGTKFDTMQENLRQQTTKGIWVCKDLKKNVLILDVEGTDGRERGENQDFERKSALFSLAIAEVLIINLWEHMVGLYNGANMGLLKTVFEVNLQLFQRKGKGKTLLLFAIRDYIGNTPLDSHAKTLRNDLSKMWGELSKPTGLEDCVIEDFFDFMFIALPHKVLQPEKFTQDVDKLRERFVDKAHENFVFKPHYHKRIPADGFSHYAEGIWEKVVTNKDLDLPTQQQLLAQYRCDEISKVAFDAFQEKIRPFKRPIETGNIVEDLGPTITEARDAAVQTFDAQASRYHQEVYQSKRMEMLNKLHSTLHVLFIGQLKNLHKKATQTFSKTLTEKMRSGNYDFMEVETEARARAEEYFSIGAQAVLLSETDWSFQDDLAQLRDDLTEIASKQRAEEIKKMVASLEKQVRKTTDESVAVSLNASTEQVWKEILDAFHTAINEAETKLKERATRFGVGTEELQHCIKLLRKGAWEGFLKKVNDETADNMMLVKMKNRLDERFRYDDQGLPRVWKPEDDIDTPFSKANEEAMRLIPLFAKMEATDSTFNPEEYFSLDGGDYDYEEAMTLFGPAKQQELNSRFKRESEAMFLEAKRSLVATEARVPYWMMVLLLALGWNEFWAIATSPIYLMFTVFFGFIAYVVYMLRLTGPVEQVARGLARQVTVVIQQRLMDANKTPEQIEMRKRE